MENQLIPQQKLDEINLRLDQNVVAIILEHIGYDIFRSYKFKLREENTPSASIRIDGYITDFGGDFRGDIISLLRTYHGMSFVESVKYVAICVGVEL